MTKKIEFHRIIKGRYNIYVVYENESSIVQDNFFSLPLDKQESIKALLKKMAQGENYRSPKIKYNLSKYNYGEIRPMPHRFFFFQKCGNNYVFFDHIEKKVSSLPDKIYKEINKRKIRYEEEFEKQFVQGFL